MKTQILFITLFLFCNYANANFYPVGKSGATTIYKQKSACELNEGHACFDITGKDLRYWVLETTQVNDMDKPLWKAHYDVESCDEPTGDCQTMQQAKTCSDEQGDIAQVFPNALLPGYKVVCTRLLGYEQKDQTNLVLNETLQAQIIAEDLAKQLTEDAISAVKKKMECGKTVKAVMALRNVQKALSVAQVSQFMQNFANISALLDSGALDTAKAEVQAITPDGTLTTNEDKTAIIGQIDLCLQ